MAQMEECGARSKKGYGKKNQSTNPNGSVGARRKQWSVKSNTGLLALKGECAWVGHWVCEK